MICCGVKLEKIGFRFIEQFGTIFLFSGLDVRVSLLPKNNINYYACKYLFSKSKSTNLTKFNDFNTKFTDFSTPISKIRYIC